MHVDVRARALPSLNLKKKRDCSPSTIGMERRKESVIYYHLINQEGHSREVCRVKACLQGPHNPNLSVSDKNHSFEHMEFMIYFSMKTLSVPHHACRTMYTAHHQPSQTVKGPKSHPVQDKKRLVRPKYRETWKPYRGHHRTAYTSRPNKAVPPPSTPPQPSQMKSAVCCLYLHQYRFRGII